MFPLPQYDQNILSEKINKKNQEKAPPPNWLVDKPGS